jgi:acyl carrier protein
MPKSIEDRVCSVVSDVLGVPREEVNRNTSHDTVENWDSVNIINLMIALESELDVEFDSEDASDLLSVELIIAVLEEKGVR